MKKELARLTGASILALGIAGCSSSNRSEPNPERLPVAEFTSVGVGTPTGEEIYQSILEGLNRNTTPTPEIKIETKTASPSQDIPEIIFRAPKPGETPNACLLPDGTHKIINIFEFNQNGPISKGSCE